jgi:hypothetical protein
MLAECVTQPCSRDPCFFPRLAALINGVPRTGKSTALYFLPDAGATSFKLVTARTNGRC